MYYTLKNFINQVAEGNIIDYDGFGFFATGLSKAERTNIYVECDIDFLTQYIGIYPYVYWANK